VFPSSIVALRSAKRFAIERCFGWSTHDYDLRSHRTQTSYHKFAGHNAYYLYEEIPRNTRPGQQGHNSFEVLLDAGLKAFGICCSAPDLDQRSGQRHQSHHLTPAEPK